MDNWFEELILKEMGSLNLTHTFTYVGRRRFRLLI